MTEAQLPDDAQRIIVSELRFAVASICAQVPNWQLSMDPYLPWQHIQNTEPQSMNRQLIWWPDVLVALFLQACLTTVQIPAMQRDAETRAAIELWRCQATGAIEIILLYAQHEVLLIEDTIQRQQWL
jgi:hypothetical protein